MYEYKAKIVKIVDGDTLDADVDLGFYVKKLMRLRLYGVNTPEIRSSILEEKIKAVEAKQYLIDKILSKDVTIRTYKDKQDKYGRYLALIVLDGEEIINDSLVDKGFAVKYYG